MIKEWTRSCHGFPSHIQRIHGQGFQIKDGGHAPWKTQQASDVPDDHAMGKETVHAQNWGDQTESEMRKDPEVTS